MASKNYIPGSEVTVDELNAIQDDYIVSGYEPWTTIGMAGGSALSSNVALDKFNVPTYLTEWENDFKVSRLDPADYANSYNGSLRTRQLRFVAFMQTDSVAIGNRVQDIALRTVATTATLNTWSYGTKLGTLTIPSLDEPETGYRFDGDPFTFPAAGQYTIQTTLSAQAATVSNVGLSVNILLQTRAV